MFHWSLQRGPTISCVLLGTVGYDWNTGRMGKSFDGRRPSSTTRACGYLGDHPLSCTARRASSSPSHTCTHVFRTTTTRTTSKLAAVLLLRVRPVCKYLCIYLQILFILSSGPDSCFFFHIIYTEFGGNFCGMNLNMVKCFKQS